MKRYVNSILIAAVILLSALPLWLVQTPSADANGKTAELFTGADDKAKDMIGTLQPDYKPWFSPILEPRKVVVTDDDPHQGPRRRHDARPRRDRLLGSAAPPRLSAHHA